jgi:hypothetical protein
VRVVLLHEDYVHDRRSGGVNRYGVSGEVGIRNAAVAGLHHGALHERHADAADHEVGSVDQLDGNLDRARNIEDVGSGIDFSQKDNAGRGNRQPIVSVKDHEVAARPPIAQVA